MTTLVATNLYGSICKYCFLQLGWSLFLRKVLSTCLVLMMLIDPLKWLSNR